MTQRLPPKKDVALALLERSNVDVYLDPRARGVVVPHQFRREPRLILKIGLNMPVPIPDLRIAEDSMSCTLSFSRSPFYCVVPWSSVFAMVGEDGRGMVWPDDVPHELAVKVVDPGPHTSQAGSPSRGARVRNARNARSTPMATPEAAGRSRKAKVPKKGTTTTASATQETNEQTTAELVSLVSRRKPHTTGTAGDATLGPGQGAGRRDGRDDPPSPANEASLGASVQRVGPVGSAGSGRTDGRPKRELPPYLRVVK